MLRGSKLAWFVASFACWSGCSEPPPAVIATELAAALERGEEADVIIELREPVALDRNSEATTILQRAAEIRSNLGSTFQVSHQYRHLAALAGRVTPGALELLRRDPNVASVTRERWFSGQLKEAVPAAGVDRTQAMFGLRGRGVRIAVLDSGIDPNHPDLQGAVVAEHCFARGACPPWNLNEGTEATDQHGHGTSVSGVIASRGVQGPPGFAPEAELVVLKAMNANNRGTEADFLASVDWLYDNLDELKVSVLNLSIASDALFDNALDCDREAATWARAIRKLVDAGVTVIAGTGNRGSTTQLPVPACNSGVLAVGATYDADVGMQPASGNFLSAAGSGFAACSDAKTQAGQISCYTNAPARVDVMAPGGPMLTTKLGGGDVTTWGTSFAAAAVSGVAALLHECNPELRPADLLGTLVATGELKLDARSGRSFPYVRTVEAVAAACPAIGVDAGAGMPEPPGSEPPGSAGSPAAGSSSPAPDAGNATGMPAKPRSDDSPLQRRYEGPTPAMPLDARPVRSGSTREDAGAGGRRAAAEGPELAPNTERISSCNTLAPGLGDSSALAWLSVLSVLTLAWWRRPRRR